MKSFTLKMISSLISLSVRAHPLVRSFALSSTAADKLSCQGSSRKFHAPWLLTLYLFGQTSATWTLKWPPDSDHTHSSLVTKSTYTHLRILSADTKVLLQVYYERLGLFLSSSQAVGISPPCQPQGYSFTISSV